MNSRYLVSTLTVAVSLAGCAQGRSAQLPDGRGAGAGAHPAGSAHASLDGPVTMPMVRPGDRQPVGIKSLPSIHTSINANLPPRDDAVRTVSNPGTATLPPSVPARSLAAPAPDSIVLPTLPPPVASEPAPPVPVKDPEVAPASAIDTAALKSDIKPGVVVGLSVATVDGEHLTLAELIAGVEEYKDTYVPPEQPLTDEDHNVLAGIILQQLIDRTLLVQEAKRRLLTTEQKQNMFRDHADKQWNSEEIPKLCRKYEVSNEFKLRELLEKRGQSLDLMHDSFYKATMAREFLQTQMQTRMATPGTPQTLMAYYRAHLDKFHLAARVTWREIVVKVDESGDRATARQAAESILTQLRQGGDFATVARSSSQGPTAYKGGLWETEPNASVVPAVNEALERLPLRQISPILEGPQGFHIVVVEDRRAAGPRPFEEVQGEIARTLQEEMFQRETESFITTLRSRAIITTPFKGTPSEPAALRDDQAVRTSAAGR